jgi:hypothetical protein
MTQPAVKEQQLHPVVLCSWLQGDTAAAAAAAAAAAKTAGSDCLAAVLISHKIRISRLLVTPL